jgi:RNA polymerase sigma-70 factor (ECF subfamily)
MNEPRLRRVGPIVTDTTTTRVPELARIRHPVADVISAASDGKQRRADEDAALVSALATDEVTALEQLYDRYSALVFSIALRVLHDHTVAEDVTQEVFLRVWRQPASFDPERGRFISWLSSVARNRSLDELRKLTRRRGAEDQIEEAVLYLPDQSRGEDPQEQAILAEERVRIRAALAELPPAQREVIELAYFSGLTQVEIAERTGDPLGTIKTRVRLGMHRLREALTDFVDQ